MFLCHYGASDRSYTLVINFFTDLLYCVFLDDHSRVVLEKIEEDVDSDYINASYIDVSVLVLFIVQSVIHMYKAA